jgi:hypothetical protein
MSKRTATRRRKEVIYIDVKTAVALVLGVAMFIVALIALMVKLIELSRK